jgi:hypothetical protein
VRQTQGQDLGVGNEEQGRVLAGWYRVFDDLSAAQDGDAAAALRGTLAISIEYVGIRQSTVSEGCKGDKARKHVARLPQPRDVESFAISGAQSR